MLKFIPYSSLDHSEWDLIVKKDLINLSYLSYFVEYLQLSYDLNNFSGIITLNQEPHVLYTIFKESKTKKILNPVLAPIYIKEIDGQLKKQINNFFTGKVLRRSEPVTYLISDCTTSTNYSNSKRKIDFNFYNMIIDLSLSQDNLWQNLSRSHKRNITKSKLSDNKIKVVDYDSSTQEINFFFDLYQKHHVEAAGKLARPEGSYFFMKELIMQKIATLFVFESSNQYLSFLYCDHYAGLARGWSQVTLKNIPERLFPRTLLEWTAILHFKNKGADTYHIGSVKTNENFKEQGFLEFKRRFGPTYIPIVEYEAIEE